MAETAQVENFRLAAARDLMAKGWAVFPLHNPIITSIARKCSCKEGDKCGTIGKHPRTATGFKEATSTSEATVCNWWSRWPAANTGIATGSASGFVVLDIDPDKGGWESFQTITDEHGQLPDTVEVNTGGNGRHLYFKNPEKKIPNSTTKLGSGLDVRGDGGYVVAPPSLHKSGNRYSWREGCGPGEIEMAEMPEWLIEILVPAEKPKPVETKREFSSSEKIQFWLGKALAKTVNGTRNETGLWLACQLRDGGASLSDVESAMRAYQQRCPGGDAQYTEREAMATARSAFLKSPREPAHNGHPKINGNGNGKHITIAKPEIAVGGASAELREYMSGVISGKIFNATFPWPLLTSLTAALLPGTTTCIIGDPGVGKTFAILECLQHWASNDYNPAVFFIEKDRRFHTMRLLAQLEGNGNFIDHDWIPKHSEEVIAAQDRHAEILDYFGQFIHSAPVERVTLDSLLKWIIEQAKAGKRIITVDPMTAIAAGDKRWLNDDDFMLSVERAMTEYGSSLLMVNHSKKGNRIGAATGHDMALGAAYHRFTDTNIWIAKQKKPKKIQYRTKCGVTQGKMDLFFQLHKTRSGRGGGQEIAFTFGEGLRFVEQGVVLKELPEEDPAETIV